MSSQQDDLLYEQVVDLHSALAEGNFSTLRESWYEESLVRMCLEVLSGLRILVSHIVLVAAPPSTSPEGSDLTFGSSAVFPKGVWTGEPTLAQYVVEYVSQEVEALAPVMSVIASTIHHNLWTLVCREVKTSLGAVLAHLRLGLGFLLSVVSPSLQTTELIQECSRQLKLHQRQLGTFIEDCREVLEKDLIEAPAPAIAAATNNQQKKASSGSTGDALKKRGKRAADQILAMSSVLIQFKDSLHFSALLSKQADPRVLGNVALLAQNEQVSPSQVELMNEHFAEPIVGVMYLHQSLTHRFQSLQDLCERIDSSQQASTIGQEMLELQSNQLAPFVHSSSDTGAQLVLLCEHILIYIQQLTDGGLLSKIHPDSAAGREAFHLLTEQVVVFVARCRRASLVSGQFQEELIALRRKLSRHMKLMDQISALSPDPILGKNLLPLTQNIGSCLDTIASEGEVTREVGEWLANLIFFFEDDAIRPRTDREILLRWLETTKESVLTECEPFHGLECPYKLKAKMESIVPSINKIKKAATSLCNAQRGVSAALHTVRDSMVQLLKNEQKRSDDGLHRLKEDAVTAPLQTGTHATPKGLLALVDGLHENLAPHLGDDLVFGSTLLREVIGQHSDTERSINTMTADFSEVGTVDLREVARCKHLLTVYNVTVAGLGKALYLSKDAVEAMLETSRQVFRPT